MLNPSAPPPFQLDEDHLSEAVRLENRVLDLRRAPMQRNLRLRHRAAMAVRRFLDEHGFIDIETPVLYKSTPEGAREFLVPSRLHEGHFYALPQSPQLFKQMLMVAGFDRYYQIVKCFRDEDLRADRQPEFTQIDIETSFLDEEEIRKLMEELVRFVFREAIGVDLPAPFPVMTYDEAMRDYGTDKPDLRIALKLAEITDAVKDVDFKVFSGPANMAGHRVCALRIPGGGTLSRSELDAYGEYAKTLGAKGLAWIKVNERGQRRRGAAIADRQEPACARALGNPREHRRAGRRRDPFRRRRSRRGRCLHGRAARQGRSRPRPGRAGLAAAVGGRVPDVRARPGDARSGRRATIRSPARRTGTSATSTARRRKPTPRPTTWC